MEPDPTAHRLKGSVLRLVRDTLRLEHDLQLVLGLQSRLRLVLDSNIVINELRWHQRKRTRGATTSLLEVLASGEVFAFAPQRLIDEVTSHFAEIAEQTRSTVERVSAAWELYRPLLTLVPDEELDRQPATAFPLLRDPTDLPFLQARSRVAARSIVSRDKDVHAAGVPVLETIDIFLDLRNYVRSKSVEVQLVVGGSALVGLGAVGVLQLLKSLPKVGGLLRRLPTWLKVVLAGLVLWLLVDPAARARIQCLLNGALTRLRAEGHSLLDTLSKVAADAEAAGAEAQTHWARVVQRLPQSPPSELSDALYGACLAAARPLSVAELVADAQSVGCALPEGDPQEHVVAALRGNSQFAEAQPGHWTLKAQMVRPQPQGAESSQAPAPTVLTSPVGGVPASRGRSSRGPVRRRRRAPSARPGTQGSDRSDA